MYTQGTELLKKDYAKRRQVKLKHGWPPQMTDLGRPTSITPQLSDSNKNLVLDPRRGLISRQTCRLTVRCNVTFHFKFDNYVLL
jgi:hypothetical protein